jgi:hypothetical protein
MQFPQFRLASFLSVTMLMLAGCGSTASDAPQTAQVSGVVTLDGSPLSEAILVFEPETGGAASTGATDEEGKYSLLYSNSQNGAVIGTHIVRISKLTMEMGMETLPSVYNSQSTLSAEVKPGENTHNFELVSKPAKRK